MLYCTLASSLLDFLPDRFAFECQQSQFGICAFNLALFSCLPGWGGA